jgi:hypothetical protein
MRVKRNNRAHPPNLATPVETRVGAVARPSSSSNADFAETPPDDHRAGQGGGVLDQPFRGREAIARGLVTPGQLRGPRFRLLFRGVHVLRSDRPLDLLTWSRAAYLLLDRRGALAGYSAAGRRLRAP